MDKEFFFMVIAIMREVVTYGCLRPAPLSLFYFSLCLPGTMVIVISKVRSFPVVRWQYIRSFLSCLQMANPLPIHFY